MPVPFGISVPLTDGRIVEVSAVEMGKTQLGLRADETGRIVMILPDVPDHDMTKIVESIGIVMSQNGPSNQEGPIDSGPLAA